MRDYAKVAPQFWTGETGKKLRAAGPETVIVAMYLMTSPHANMIGLYYLPMVYLLHETGLPIEGASKGLARAIEAHFCQYDDASEMVWVIEMARFQIADALDAKDKRCKGIENELAKVPDSLMRRGFYAKYGKAFNLPESFGKGKGLARGFEAPPKPRAGTGARTGAEKNLERQAARFDEFWALYPNKKGRKDAEAKWAAKGCDAIAEQIIADVKARMVRDKDWLRGYVPHGKTYVNGEGWRDGLPGDLATADDAFQGAL